MNAGSKMRLRGGVLILKTFSEMYLDILAGANIVTLFALAVSYSLVQ